MKTAVWVFQLFLLLISLPNSNLSWGHARFIPGGSLKARSNNAGIKSGPCGGYPKISNPSVLTPGSTINVEWEEVVNHPGRFEFYFSLNADANFVKLKTVEDNQNGGGLPHKYSTSITLPNKTCTDCTLQMIQVMTENPSSPSFYYSCVDIQLEGPLNNSVPEPVEPGVEVCE